MYHKITLVGRLGRDPEMRIAPSGDAITNFSVATSEKWTGQDGQKKERTVWWRVQAWAKLGEVCNEYLKKGSKVLVECTMLPDPETGSPRIWQGNDAQPRTSYEVRAGVVRFLDSRGDEPGEASDTSENEQPTRSNGGAKKGYARKAEPENETEIPF